mgnify:CR=1 FL=1
MWKVILAGGSFAGHVRVVPDPDELRERCYCEHKSAHGSHTGAVRFASRKGRDHRPDRRLTLGSKLQNRLTRRRPHRHQPRRPPRRPFIKQRCPRPDDLGNKLGNSRLFQKPKPFQRTPMLRRYMPCPKPTMRPDVLSHEQANFRLRQRFTRKIQGWDNAERQGPG